jgi:hypothetical protein
MNYTINKLTTDMRKTPLTRSLSFTLLLFVFVMFSCKKDELRSKELLVFVPGEYGSVNNTITAFLTHTPLSVWGNTSFDISVAATREVPSDVDVYIRADTSVSKFNADNKTSYLLLPSTTYKIVGDTKRTISSGKLISDPITIEIIDAVSLTDAKGYILPITIEKISSKDKGVQISANQSTVYLAIPYQFTNVDTVQTVLAGTLMSRTGWSVTVSNSSSGSANQASNMLDGNNATVWRSSSSSSAAKTITLNMGTAQSVKGFQLSPNYTNVNENATQMTISTSIDNVAYTVQGIWKGTGPASGSSATAPDYKGVNFVAPVNAQYFKFDITARISGNIVGVAEINAMQ